MRGNVKSPSFLMSFNQFSFLYDAIDDHRTPYNHLRSSSSYSPDPKHQSMVDDISLADNQGAAQAGGDSPISVTCLAFFKSFVATGILFIPQGYYNGGVIGSTVVNMFVGALATHCMALLLDCRDVLVSNPDTLMDTPPPRTYGDIASHVHPWGRTLVQCMIVGSQVGFCCVYLSFIAGIAGNSFPIASLSLSTQSIATMALVAALVIPLTWIRSLHLFGPTNLVAMIIVFTAIATILCGSVYQLANQGIAPNIKWGINQNFLMFFGTSVYAFEGIAMVLPIEAEMKDPTQMKSVMTKCMLTIVLFICSVGALGYMAFGDNIEDIVLKNLAGLCGGHAWCTTSVKVLVGFYCVSVLFTFPLMMVPVVKILESKIFAEDGDHMWAQNGFRGGLVMLCLVIAIAANKSLEHFVSIMGSLACIPLAFMMPAWFHYTLVSSQDGNTFGKVTDIAILAFGAVAMVVSLLAAVTSWAGYPILLPV